LCEVLSLPAESGQVSTRCEKCVEANRPCHSQFREEGSRPRDLPEDHEPAAFERQAHLLHESTSSPSDTEGGIPYPACRECDETPIACLLENGQRQNAKKDSLQNAIIVWNCRSSCRVKWANGVTKTWSH